MDPERLVKEGWTPYAPLDADPNTCDFCGEPRDRDRRLIANDNGSVAICEQCVGRFAALFARTGS